MKFIMAYSGGKDCTLAMDRMINEGHEPVALFTTVTERGLNYKHGIRIQVYDRYEEAFNVSIVRCLTNEIHDDDDLYGGLSRAKEKYGATCLCTGDIYREDVYGYNKMLAQKVGLELSCPLWKTDSRDAIMELLDKGYECYIKMIKTKLLPTELLGKQITKDLIDVFESHGIDICGEDGEYHSIMVNGPIFKKPIDITFGNILEHNDMAMIDIT